MKLKALFAAVAIVGFSQASACDAPVSTDIRSDDLARAALVVTATALDVGSASFPSSDLTVTVEKTLPFDDGFVPAIDITPPQLSASFEMPAN
jgi:hypothetical protein